MSCTRCRNGTAPANSSEYPFAAAAHSARVLLSGLPVTTERKFSRCSLSADGRRLIYIPRKSTPTYGASISLGVTEAGTLTKGTRQFTNPKVSPDGKWITATRGSGSDPELVKIPIGGGEPISLGEGTGPAWSIDGQRLAFVSHRSGSNACGSPAPTARRPRK